MGFSFPKIPTVTDIVNTVTTAVETGTGVVTDIAEGVGDVIGDVFDTATGGFDPANWSGWSDASMNMASLQGFTDPSQVPDWLKTMWDKGADAYNEGVTTGSEVLGDVLGDDPVGDIKDQADKAETSINETVADTMDTGQSNLEGILDENTDTLNQMEDTINYNVDQGNAALGNLQNVVHDVTAGINKNVLDPLIGPGENSLINNPTGWYENAFHNWSIKSASDLPGGKNWHEENVGDAAESIGGVFDDYGNVLGGLLGGLVGGVFGGVGGGDDGGGGGAGSTADQLAASRRNKQGLEGDPFGNPSETRRLINRKRTFSTAPSLINA